MLHALSHARTIHKSPNTFTHSQAKGLATLHNRKKKPSHTHTLSRDSQLQKPLHLPHTPLHTPRTRHSQKGRAGPQSPSSPSVALTLTLHPRVLRLRGETWEEVRGRGAGLALLCGGRLWGLCASAAAIRCVARSVYACVGFGLLAAWLCVASAGGGCARAQLRRCLVAVGRGSLARSCGAGRRTNTVWVKDSKKTPSRPRSSPSALARRLSANTKNIALDARMEWWWRCWWSGVVVVGLDIARGHKGGGPVPQSIKNQGQRRGGSGGPSGRERQTSEGEEE